MAEAKKTTSDADLQAVRMLGHRLAWVAALAVPLVYIVSAFLILLGLEMTRRQLLIGFGFGVLVIPLNAAVDFYGVRWTFRPIRAWLEAVEADRPCANLVQLAYVRLLNFPLLTTVRIMVLHAGFAYTMINVLVVFANATMDFDVQLWQLTACNATIFITVAAHAILESFVALALVRPVVPVVHAHAGDLSPDQGRRIIQVGIWQRLLTISIWMAFIPMVVLGFTVMVRVNNLLLDFGVDDPLSHLGSIITWIIALTVAVTAVTVTIAIVMARDIRQLIGQMVGAMRSVEDGDLGVNLEVSTTDEFATLYTGFNNMTLGLREREQLHDAFGRYVSPELAEQVLQQGVELSGETVAASVLFTDIRDYTATTENMDAPAIVRWLNAYFARVEPVIKAEGGWINKFLGDGFMVIFGAPTLYPDHAERAVRSALAIRKATAEFNRQRDPNQPEIRIGIGIECGQIVAGTMGSPDRLEYTVIGSAVNIAARIEALNKEFGTTILVSESVYQAIPETDHLQPMPPAQVKGRSDPIQVYAVPT